MRQAPVLLIGLLLVGCRGIPVHVQSFHEGTVLKGIHTVYVQAGAVSWSKDVNNARPSFWSAMWFGGSTNVSSTVNINSSAPAHQTDSEILGKKLAFSLMEHGLKTTQEKEQADAIVTFSVDARMDRDGAWVAETMFLEFQDPKTNAPLCVFKADSGGFEPVEDLVEALGKKVSLEPR